MISKQTFVCPSRRKPCGFLFLLRLWKCFKAALGSGHTGCHEAPCGAVSLMWSRKQQSAVGPPACRQVVDAFLTKAACQPLKALDWIRANYFNSKSIKGGETLLLEEKNSEKWGGNQCLQNKNPFFVKVRILNRPGGNCAVGVKPQINGQKAEIKPYFCNFIGLDEIYICE